MSNYFLLKTKTLTKVEEHPQHTIELNKTLKI